MARVVPKVIGYVQIGPNRYPVETSLEGVQFFDDMQNSADPDEPGINTVLAGVNRAEAKVDGVIDGTQVLATVTTSDAGNIPTALEALGTNSGVVSGLSVVPVSVSAFITGAGLATTNAVTADATFGTGPWTYAWAFASGDAFTITSPAAATTTFSAVLSDGETRNATYAVTATDSLAATKTTAVAVTAFSTPVS